MLARTPLIDLAIAWAEQQNPDGEYNWDSVDGCACGQFARSVGRQKEWAAEYFHDHSLVGWKSLNSLAQFWPRTFGGFLERMKEYRYGAVNCDPDHNADTHDCDAGAATGYHDALADADA
jgi:hypothetical protein